LLTFQVSTKSDKKNPDVGVRIRVNRTSAGIVKINSQASIHFWSGGRATILIAPARFAPGPQVLARPKLTARFFVK
jgi:hypothetical protein